MVDYNISFRNELRCRCPAEYNKKSIVFVSTWELGTTLSAEILWGLTEDWAEDYEENVKLRKTNYSAVLMFCSFLEDWELDLSGAARLSNLQIAFRRNTVCKLLIYVTGWYFKSPVWVRYGQVWTECRAKSSERLYVRTKRHARDYFKGLFLLYAVFKIQQASLHWFSPPFNHTNAIFPSRICYLLFKLAIHQ